MQGHRRSWCTFGDRHHFSWLPYFSLLECRFFWRITLIQLHANQHWLVPVFFDCELGGAVSCVRRRSPSLSPASAPSFRHPALSRRCRSETATSCVAGVRLALVAVCGAFPLWCANMRVSRPSRVVMGGLRRSHSAALRGIGVPSSVVRSIERRTNEPMNERTPNEQRMKSNKRPAVR